jgi:AAA15 family ATPase/GTPase
MGDLVQTLHINNFKSIRDLHLDCARINVFIGKPNAGKSNILEAISLLGAGDHTKNKFMQDFIRYEFIYELFSNFDIQNPITISYKNSYAHLGKAPEGENFVFTTNYSEIMMNHDGTIKTRRYDKINPDSIKKYDFKPAFAYQDNGLSLHPPHGENLYLIIRSIKKIREDIQDFLKSNDLKLLLDDGAKRIVVVQETGETLLGFPFHLSPDTFQRYIFHLAAIMSNRDSVLLFEEPESHSYAPYVYQLAQHMLDDEGGNQYFITTHNPYLLTPILQEGKDVALFVTWFEDYQTRARRLSEKEVGDILNYGMDIFLNLKYFIPK